MYVVNVCVDTEGDLIIKFAEHFSFHEFPAELLCCVVLNLICQKGRGTMSTQRFASAGIGKYALQM
jgi:hypothetical protein